jgi:uncharacterized protein (TIGR03067 family)
MNVKAFAFALILSPFAARLDAAAPAAEPAQAQAQAPACAGDLSRLQGCWTAKAGARRELKVTLDVEGRTVRVRIVTPQGLTIRAQGELRIDETTAPRALDWVNFLIAGQEENFPDIPAIYTLRGETLTICNGGPNGIRPVEFKAGDGVLADVLTFERPTPGAPAETGGGKLAQGPLPVHPETKASPSQGGKP